MGINPPSAQWGITIKGDQVGANWLMWFAELQRILTGTYLADNVAGTPNEITVTDDGDGTITVSGAGSDTDFSVVTAIQAGGAGGVGFQYKTRALTLNGGIITAVGAESGWNDI